MDLLEFLAGERQEYKCYDELKRLLTEDENFRKIIEEGIASGKIRGFDKELWEKIRTQNIRRINSFEDVFIDGANIGYCTVASRQLSFSLNSCYICGGVLPILKGTRNCVDGRHTWISHGDEIIDTTLMLILKEEYSPKIGYIEENRYNPNVDPIYSAAKDFTNDSSLRR